MFAGVRMTFHEGQLREFAEGLNQLTDTMRDAR